MPQLNPAPWFTTLLFAWLTLLLILAPALGPSLKPKHPTPHTSLITRPYTNWPWTWY